MNQSTLFMMWQIILSNNARKNMSGDFSGEALDSAVSAIVDATILEPIDVHHCIAILDGTIVELLVQQNGLIVSRIDGGAK